MRHIWKLVVLGLVFLGFMAAQASAAEPRLVRFAYLTAVDLLPYFVADKKGYFLERGMKVEPILVTTGAGVVGAVMGGSADIGYAGSLPIISARVQGLPLKFFSGLALDQGPDHYTLVYLANPKAGIKSVRDLKGKVVAMNARSGQCELIAKLRLAEAGMSLDDVKVTTIPFPQMQAALQLGSVDAACTNDPFLTSMRQAGLNAIVMKGLVKQDVLSTPHMHSGLFATDKWLADNKDVALAFRASLDRAIKEIESNDKEARQILAEYTKVSPQVINDVQFSMSKTELPASAVQLVIDAAVATNLITKRIEASEVIFATH
jgi:NitT/TauT family transport system substrate-binding protein